MEQPLFSIITVTYNASSTIGPTLESVKNQTFRDFEYLVMDGASTDSTVELAKEARIEGSKIFSSPDHGLYDAMNKGLSEANGLYVIFLNAGDAFHGNTTLETIAKAIADNDIPGVVYGQTDIVDSSRRKIADRHLLAPEKLTLASFADGMVVCHQAFVALRRIVPYFNTSYRFSADYDWCIQCLQHSRKNVYIPETIIDYLSEGVTTANRRKSLMERFRIMSYYYGTIPTLARHLHFVGRYFKYRKSIKR